MTPKRRTRKGLGAWLRYRFDETVSRGPVRVLGWMFLFTFLAVAAIVLLLHAAGQVPADEEGASQGFWATVWRGVITSFAGPSGVDGMEGGWIFVAGMFVIGLIGMSVVWGLIGVISTAISDYAEKLRRGRSQVVEHGHTVIIGWSSHVPTIVQELALAREEEGRASCVAVLADKDKVEMEDEIETRVVDAGRMRVVCRSGSPIDTNDVALVNPFAARAVIVVAPEDADDPDVHVLKSVLAILRNRRKGDSEGPHIVAEVRDPAHLPVLKMVGRGRVRPIVADELIARVTVQASRQAGLSLVWNDLLDFSGHELYVHREPRLAGKRFADACVFFDGAVPVGLRRAGGELTFLPAGDTVIAADDALVVLATDDSEIHAAQGVAAADEAGLAPVAPDVGGAERTLVLGWSGAGATVLQQLGLHAPAGGSVTVVSAVAVGERGGEGSGGLTVEHREGATTDRALLDALGVEGYQHVIVLPERGLPANEADARTLVTLLHLRDMARGAAARPFNLVSELRDVRNRDLAEESRADDYIVSDRLVSLMLAQAAENPDLPVNALLESRDVDLVLRQAGGYVTVGRAVDFETVRAAAERRGELALGWFIGAEGASGRRAVHLGPRRGERVTFGANDQIVLLRADRPAAGV